MTKGSAVNRDESEANMALSKLTVMVESLQESPKKKVYMDEINKARMRLEKGDYGYVKKLYGHLKWLIRRRCIFNFLLPEILNESDKKVVSLIKGFSYCALVLIAIGICVLIVIAEEKEMISYDQLGFFRYLFESVEKFEIKPLYYLFGLFGAAGAVTSIVKRLDQLISQSDSIMKFFLIGLLYPIIGSVVAVVLCQIMPLVFNIKAIGGVPEKAIKIAIAFFSGYSERILERAEHAIAGRKE